MTYPSDFPVPVDQGGPGAGQPIGGYGGNPAFDRSAHRTMVADTGKAPVILVHGNGGAADVRPWDLLDQKRFLVASGYAEELIWAPSYLAQGSVDLLTPHTNNVDEVRGFLDAVCAYLGVDVVDVIAHSLGCSLMYAVFRGLDRQGTPTWNQPKRWHRVGTFVSLAGAFHGLGTGSIGEWRTGGEFMTELLAETEGGGGETPFDTGSPLTPPPLPHTISYFCGVAAGDFVDAQNPGTGRLDGAVNRSYNLGSGQQGHQAVKESRAVFDDFLPLLNAVPPVPAATLTLDPDSGPASAPLTVTIGVDPSTLVVDVRVIRLTKQFVNGYIVETVAETSNAALRDGETATLATPGLWQLTATASGAVDPLERTYWVGVPRIVATITTDNTIPFDTSLLVAATSSDPTAALYFSLDGATWTEGATVTITQDSVVSFIAINPIGIPSEVVRAGYTKRVTWEDAVTADAVGHFVAGRIGVEEYLAYSDQFGFFTPFTLYLVDGDWVLDPQRPTVVLLRTDQIDAINSRAARQRPQLRATSNDARAEPQVGGSVLLTVEAPDNGTTGHEAVTVYYTQDGSIPTVASPSFAGTATFEIPVDRNHVVACYATDEEGNQNYQAFPHAGRPTAPGV
jgi:pimeloyl-ACP methyl ester carboxylesterase